MQFGKTRAGCLIATRTFNRHSDKPILIVVFNQIVKANWESAITDYTSLVLGEQVLIKTITEIINDSNNKIVYNVNLMIIDEIHKSLSPIAYSIFTTVRYKFILGLTGTYPVGNDKRKLDKYCPVVDVITEQEALTNKWIAPFREYNILLDLPLEDKIRYEGFTTPIKEIMAIFKNSYREFRIGNSTDYLCKNDYDVLMGCYAGVRSRDMLGKSIYFKAEDVRHVLASRKGWHQQLDLDNELSNQIDVYWNPTSIENYAKKFIDMVRRRNELLINHDVKLAAVVEIFKKNPTNTICFNESTDFADLIVDTINKQYSVNNPPAVVYHSNISSRSLVNPLTGELYRTAKGEIKIFGKTTLRNLTLEGLRNGTYKFLCTAKALDEGVSVPSLRQVITTAGSANPIQYKQRSARGKTIDSYDPNKITNIFNLCFNDFIGSDGKLVNSRDLQKLLIRQQNTAVQPITINGLSGLNDLQI
jgi:superfamily II DNA or RNA helicase